MNWRLSCVPPTEPSSVVFMFRKDSGQEVLTNVTSEAEYHNYGKRPASEIRA